MLYAFTKVFFIRFQTLRMRIVSQRDQQRQQQHYGLLYQGCDTSTLLGRDIGEDNSTVATELLQQPSNDPSADYFSDFYAFLASEDFLREARDLLKGDDRPFASHSASSDDESLDFICKHHGDADTTLPRLGEKRNEAHRKYDFEFDDDGRHHIKGRTFAEIVAAPDSEAMMAQMHVDAVAF